MFKIQNNYALYSSYKSSDHIEIKKEYSTSSIQSDEKIVKEFFKKSIKMIDNTIKRLETINPKLFSR